MNFAVKTADLAGVELALSWAAAEGWNPGLSDAGIFHACDPTGFHIGAVDGRGVATLSAVKYGGDFAFVGLYIVLPEFRGRGLGLATWRHALEPLAERNIGLDGVPAKQAAYARSGFVAVHRNIRFEIKARPGTATAAELPPVPPDALPAIQAFDREFFPADRATFLMGWLTQPGVETCCVEVDGNVRAYGVMRPCREGWKIGPLFAREADAAGSVFATLLARSAGRPVYMDVPENNAAAVALARNAGAVPVFESARMYTRGQPEGVNWAGVFGITTLELG